MLPLNSGVNNPLEYTSATSISECNIDEDSARKWRELRWLHDLTTSSANRFQSFERVAHTIAGGAGAVGLERFVAGMVGAYKFPGDARAEQRLRALYKAHTGAARGAVDLREIAAGALLLRQHRLIRESPRQLLVALCELFTEDGGELLARSDALKVVSLAATTATEVYLTAGKMDRHLEEMAASYNLKPTFKMLPLDLFLDVLDTHTALLSAIAGTMWARVPVQWRLACLQEAEDAGIGRLSAALSAIKAARAAAHRRRALVGAHWRAWRRFAERCRVERHQRETVLRCRCAAAARRWRRRARAAARMARLRNAAVAMGARRILRLRLAQLRAATAERHRVTRALWTSSAAGKRVLLGVARWRAVERRARQRSALRRWCETASLMSAWDFAVATSGERTRRRAFRALRAYVAHALSQRHLEAEAEARAAAVVEIAAKAEADAVALALAEEAQERARRAARKAALVAAKAAEAARAKEAEAAAGVARERAVLQEQQAVRRRRVRDQAAAALEQHKAYWAVHTEELVATARRRRREWLSGGGGDAARYEVEKGVAALRRRFLAAPSPETAQLERALADPANIVFAFVASRLWSRQVTLRDFFNEFDVEHDGYLAPAEFETLVASLGIQLDGEKVRAMTRSIDADGGGLIDCDEFQAAMARHEQVCGHAGSPWKMYVSPVHGVMTLHNIETGEQLMDYKTTILDLMRVTIDTMVGEEEVLTRSMAAIAASNAWVLESEARAARVLQGAYRRWKGRRDRGMVRWVWDAQRTAAAAARLRAAAVTLQCWWRGAAARARAGALLHLTIERICDPATGAEYFFNHNYGTSSWTEPYMPRRARGACAPLQPLPAWSLIVRATGAAYYRHAESGDTADAPPPGHVPCQACRAALALRRCATDGVALCFACYRREHGDGVDPEGWRHPWTPMAAHLCEVCSKRFAERACVACGNSGGGALSQRSAGLRAASSTASSPRTARAAAARLYCPHCWDRAHGAGAPRGHAPLSLLDWAHAQTADRAAEAAAAAARDAQRAALGLSAPPLRGSAALLPRAQRRGTLPIALAPRVAPVVLGGGGGGGGDVLAISDGSAAYAAAPWTESYGGEYNPDGGLLESLQARTHDAAAAAGASEYASPAGARSGAADYGGADVFGRDGRPLTVIIQ